MTKTTMIELEHSFEAAHHLPDSEGLTTKKCLNMHGHTYLARVFVQADTLSDNFVVDFGALKRAIDCFDHATIVWREDDVLLTYLSVVGSKHYVIDTPPTAENIAAELYRMLGNLLPLTAEVREVWVCEGSKPGKVSWVKYREEAE